MNIRYIRNPNRPGQRGAVAVFVAITLVVLIGLTAFAVDVGYLYGVKNELHNAADAGALAGAHKLFDHDTGNLTVAEAILEAERITPLNSTGNEAVAHLPIETGHWSFTEYGGKGHFSPMPGVTEQYSTWQTTSFSVLDTTHEFINAVRVRTQRPETPSFFARIFGIDKFFLTAEAVAYIGFAGTLFPKDVDEPIAICEEAIKEGKEYSCLNGRMLNSGNNTTTSETALWTDFTQSDETTDVCKGGTNANDVAELIQTKKGECLGSNTTTIYFGKDLALTNGVGGNKLFGSFRDCWLKASEEGTIPWEITLPVVRCSDAQQTTTCAELVGAVTVNVVWVTELGEDKDYSKAPTLMGDWPGEKTFDTPQKRWEDFVDHFKLKNVEYLAKTIYFLPDCTPHEPVGTTGGENFGILAEIPVLVQ